MSKRWLVVILFVIISSGICFSEETTAKLWAKIKPASIEVSGEYTESKVGHLHQNEIYPVLVGSDGQFDISNLRIIIKNSISFPIASFEADILDTQQLSQSIQISKDNINQIDKLADSCINEMDNVEFDKCLPVKIDMLKAILIKNKSLATKSNVMICKKIYAKIRRYIISKEDIYIEILSNDSISDLFLTLVNTNPAPNGDDIGIAKKAFMFNKSSNNAALLINLIIDYPKQEIDNEVVLQALDKLNSTSGDLAIAAKYWKIKKPNISNLEKRIFGNMSYEEASCLAKTEIINKSANKKYGKLVKEYVDEIDSNDKLKDTVRSAKAASQDGRFSDAAKEYLKINNKGRYSFDIAFNSEKALRAGQDLPEQLNNKWYSVIDYYKKSNTAGGYYNAGLIYATEFESPRNARLMAEIIRKKYNNKELSNSLLDEADKLDAKLKGYGK